MVIKTTVKNQNQNQPTATEWGKKQKNTLTSKKISKKQSKVH
jgi:hypothetical protein